jgi:hypothetical protein
MIGARSTEADVPGATADRREHSVRGFFVSRQRGERGKRQLRLGQFERFGFELEAAVPAGRGTGA